MFEKANKYLTEEITIKRMRLIVFIIGVVLSIFMATDLFDNLHVVAKVLIIAGMFGVSILFKVDMFSKKEVGKQIMGIYKSKEMSWQQKCLEMGNIAVELLNEAGILWETGLDEQFPKENPLHEKTKELTGHEIEKIE